MPDYVQYSPGNVTNQKFTYTNEDGVFHVDGVNGTSIYKATPIDNAFYTDPLQFIRFATMTLSGGGTDSGTIYRVPNESFFLFFSLSPINFNGQEIFRFYYSLDGNVFQRWLTASGTKRKPLQVTITPPPPTTPPPGTGPTPTVFPLTFDHSNSDDQTKAFASAKISKQPDKGLVELNIRVKKSGVNGKGFGYAQAVLLDKDGNTLFKTSVISENVGADVLSGSAEDDHTESFEFPLTLLPLVAHAAVIVEAKNNNGLPDSIEEFTETLIKVRDFLRAVVGVLEEVVKIVAIVASA